MIDKNKIKENFSRSAPVYEEHAFLQKQLADELFSRIKKLKPSRILDIGCGAGYLTHKIAQQFPQAEVVGIDFARGMIDAAKKKPRIKNLSFVIEDGEDLSFEPKSFDLIISNLAFQWMDSCKAVKQVRRILMPGGKFVFQTFGPQTLGEIRRLGFRVNSFPPIINWEQILVGIFLVKCLETKIIQQEFNRLKEAFVYLKQIGAQGIEESAKMGISTIRRNYKQNGLDRAKIKLSFEVIFGEVERKSL